MTDKAKPSQSDPKKNRRIVLISGGALLFFGLYLLAFLVPDVLQTAGGATSMTLANAAEVATDVSTYVSIEDGEWDCDTISYIRRRSSTSSIRRIQYTEVFLTSENQPRLVVLLATLSGEIDCDELEGITPTGYLTQMSEDKQQELTNEARLARFFDATTFLEFCGYCGAENSSIGLIFGIVLTLAGFALFMFGYRMPKGSQPTEGEDDIIN